MNSILCMRNSSDPNLTFHQTPDTFLAPTTNLIFAALRHYSRVNSTEVNTEHETVENMDTCCGVWCWGGGGGGGLILCFHQLLC